MESNLIRSALLFVCAFCLPVNGQYYNQYPNQQSFVPQTGQYGAQPAAYGQQQLGYNPQQQQSLLPGFGNFGNLGGTGNLGGMGQQFPQSSLYSGFTGTGLGGRSLDATTQAQTGNQFQQQPTAANNFGGASSQIPVQSINTGVSNVQADTTGMTGQGRNFDGSVGQMQYAVPQNNQLGYAGQMQANPAGYYQQGK